MIKKLTIIGATGKLAIPIINQLHENRVEITAIVRNFDKAQEVLPTGTKILIADLADKESLANALQGTEYLYLNLSVHEPDAEFVAEIDGIKNILEAAKCTSLKQILKISGIGALYPEFNIKNEIYDANEVRAIGHQLIKDSGIAYTIFHPTWFLNALPWFIKDDKFIVYGKDEQAFYWTNTTDFADQITEAIGNEAAYNQDFAVQGNEAFTFQEAAKRFLEVYNPEVGVVRKPISKEMGRFGLLLAYYENFKEKFVADKTWQLLGEPSIKFEEFVAQSLK